MNIIFGRTSMAKKQTLAALASINSTLPYYIYAVRSSENIFSRALFHHDSGFAARRGIIELGNLVTRKFHPGYGPLGFKKSLSASHSTSAIACRDDKSTSDTSEEEGLEICNLGISEDIVSSLARKGITKLFPIQKAVLEPAMQGRDMIGRARTGTGKTLAFGIPILDKIISHCAKFGPGKIPLALVLAPTRELARQVDKEFCETAPILNTVCIYGGASIYRQTSDLNHGVDVVVGTPGRVIDLLNRGALDLSAVQFVVLDEADQMLNVGFQEAVEVILEKLPQKRQSLMFSATMPTWIKQLTSRYLNDPLVIDLVGDSDQKLPDGITIYSIASDMYGKSLIIGPLITEYAKGGKCIVFTQTKRDADRLAYHMSRDVKCEALHGDISQKQREITLSGFREGRFNTLVATDVAARGLDIPNVDLVIHYELPNSSEIFVHRTGRTGRAGKKGNAIIIYTDDKLRAVKTIEREVGCNLIPLPKRANVGGASDAFGGLAALSGCSGYGGYNGGGLARSVGSGGFRDFGGSIGFRGDSGGFGGSSGYGGTGGSGTARVGSGPFGGYGGFGKSSGDSRDGFGACGDINSFRVGSEGLGGYGGSVSAAGGSRGSGSFGGYGDSKSSVGSSADGFLSSGVNSEGFNGSGRYGASGGALGNFGSSGTLGGSGAYGGSRGGPGDFGSSGLGSGSYGSSGDFGISGVYGSYGGSAVAFGSSGVGLGGLGGYGGYGASGVGSGNFGSSGTLSGSGACGGSVDGSGGFSSSGGLGDSGGYSGSGVSRSDFGVSNSGVEGFGSSGVGSGCVSDGYGGYGAYGSSGGGFEGFGNSGAVSGGSVGFGTPGVGYGGSYGGYVGSGGGFGDSSRYSGSGGANTGGGSGGFGSSGIGSGGFGGTGSSGSFGGSGGYVGSGVCSGSGVTYVSAAGFANSGVGSSCAYDGHGSAYGSRGSSGDSGYNGAVSGGYVGFNTHSGGFGGSAGAYVGSGGDSSSFGGSGGCGGGSAGVGSRGVNEGYGGSGGSGSPGRGGVQGFEGVPGGYGGSGTPGTGSGGLGDSSSSGANPTANFGVTERDNEQNSWKT